MHPSLLQPLLPLKPLVHLSYTGLQHLLLTQTMQRNLLLVFNLLLTLLPSRHRFPQLVVTTLSPLQLSFAISLSLEHPRALLFA